MTLIITSIYFSVKLSHKSNSIPLAGVAIDPESESNITVIKNYIKSGSYLGKNNKGILIGSPIANKINLKPGDTVFLTAMDKYGVENLIDTKVAGIFFFNFPAMDKQIIFTDLDTASFLLSMEDEVSKIVLSFNDNKNNDSKINNINENYRSKGIKSYTWKKFEQTVVSAVEADSNSFYLILIILYILIVLGILNSTSMNIYERTKEIGTLRAIGMKKNEVILLFLFESIGLSVISAVIAFIISLPAVYYLGFVGIDISSSIPEEIPVPFGEMFYADFSISHFIIAISISCFSVILGSIKPSKRAADLVISKALGTTNLG